MPIWGFVLIWLVCGFAIALILGHALRTIDETAPVADREPEEQVEWPEFRVLRVEQPCERSADFALPMRERGDRS